MRIIVKHLFLSFSLVFAMTVEVLSQQRSQLSQGLAHKVQRQTARQHLEQSKKYSPFQSTTGDVNIEWERHYNSVITHTQGNAVAVDADGNVYIAGTNNGNYITACYRADGALRWYKKYGSIDVPDPFMIAFNATSIAVDSGKNVLVTGWHYDGDPHLRIITLKYNYLGDTLWIREFPGEYVNIDDEYASVAVVVDDSGCAYVSGVSNGSDYAYRIATIKYDPQGDTLWTRYTIGSNYGWEQVILMDIDTVGNIFVDAGTIACTYTASGERISLSNGSVLHHLQAIDRDGNICTAQRIYDGNDCDIETFKCTPIGDTLWLRRFDGSDHQDDGPYSITVDQHGCIYVVGVCDAHYYRSTATEGDLCIIKYDPSGNIIQYNHLSGIPRSLDKAVSSTMDRNGNLYITGDDYRFGPQSAINTLKVDMVGRQVWHARYSGLIPSYNFPDKIVVDLQGNVFVSGLTNADATLDEGFQGTKAIMKFNADGEIAWARQSYGLAGYTELDRSLIALDSEGDIVYANDDILKLNTNGDTLWMRSHRLIMRQNFVSKNGSMILGSVVADNNGFIYLSGVGNAVVGLHGYVQSGDIGVIKYNVQGGELWYRNYKGPSTDRGAACATAIDRNGNVIVAGLSESMSTLIDYAIIKYNPDGDTLWTRTYNGSGNSVDIPTSIIVDDSGNVYVTGSSYDSNHCEGYATIKYSPSGYFVWMRYISGSSSMSTFPNHMASDPDGNIYMTCTSDGAITTLKYDQNGNQCWIARYSIGEGSWNYPCGLHVDQYGNVLVAGTSQLSSRSFYTIIKYKQTLTVVKERQNIFPADYMLEQNYPNPFNPTTKICFSIPKMSHAKLSIFDLLGREVAVLVNEQKPAGRYTSIWDGSKITSGIYFYTLTAGLYRETKRMILLK